VFVLSIPAIISNGVKAYYDWQVQQLCAVDGGVRVYENVDLSREEYSKLLDSFGRIWIPSKDSAQETDVYYADREIYHYRKGNPSLYRSEYKIIRRSDEKVLGESIRYGRTGGDLPGPWHHSSFKCPDPVERPSNLVKEI